MTTYSICIHQKILTKLEANRQRDSLTAKNNVHMVYPIIIIIMHSVPYTYFCKQIFSNMMPSRTTIKHDNNKPPTVIFTMEIVMTVTVMVVMMVLAAMMMVVALMVTLMMMVVMFVMTLMITMMRMILLVTLSLDNGHKTTCHLIL